MKSKIILIVIGTCLTSYSFGQSYTGNFYSPNPQGMFTDAYFNLHPNSGATSGNTWNIYHLDGSSSLFSVAFGAAAPSIQIGASRTTNFYVNGLTGIGTSTPDGFQVNASLSSEASQSSNNIRMGILGGSPRLLLDYAGSTTFELDNFAGRFRIFKPGLELFTINSSGSVGVGTIPSALMHIKGAAQGNAVLFIEPNQWTGPGDYGELRFGDAYHYIRGENTNGMTFYDYNKFAFLGGSVGIGTASPDATLAVKGQIHAQEVKVDLNGAVAPDYVFDKNYNLTSLDSIKIYIDQYKHLPEVPSASAMEKNGVQLGEMNMLLLKKIEELTLYSIEMKKLIEELKQENAQQQNEIENLKTQNHSLRK